MELCLLALACIAQRIGDDAAAALNIVALAVQMTVQPQPRVRQQLVGKEVVDKYYSEEAEKVLGPVSKFLVRHGIDPKSVWKVGHAGENIAKMAESGKFDLLVMGSHGHSALGNLVMGSVATQVLAHCSVPVLLVR